MAARRSFEEMAREQERFLLTFCVGAKHRSYLHCIGIGLSRPRKERRYRPGLARVHVQDGENARGDVFC